MNNHTTSIPRTTSPIDWDYTCPNCQRGCNIAMAYEINIVDETDAELVCPWCRHTAIYVLPEIDDIERPPAIVDYTIVADDQGLTTAWLYFEGGAWLQYRRAPDEWVYEELFTADGEEVASFNTEFERDDCETPRTYLHREMDRYEAYTVGG